MSSSTVAKRRRQKVPFGAIRINYVGQESDYACGLAVVQMILQGFGRNTTTQHELQCRFFERRCKMYQTRVTLPLSWSQINWLLDPIRCHWMKHDTRPCIRFKSLRHEIDKGRPVILYLKPSFDQDSNDFISLGHVVLLVGYTILRHEEWHDEQQVQSLLIYDPQEHTGWELPDDVAPSVVQASFLSNPRGRRVVTYAGLSRHGVTIKSDSPRARKQNYRWFATGLLEPHLLD